MDGAILPLNFYCRNAQLCLKKASDSKKSHLSTGELQHLKAFTTLVSTTIPSHPLYLERKEEKPLLELQSYLTDATKRIVELEAEGPCGRPPLTTNGKVSRLKVDKSADRSADSTRQLVDLETEGPCGRTLLTTNAKVSRLNTDKSMDRLFRTRPNSPQVLSPKSMPDSVSKSQTRVQKLQRRRPEEAQQCKVTWSPEMNETYGVVSKSAPSRRSTPTIQRLKNVTDSMAADSKPQHHQHHSSKDSTKSQALVNPAPGEITPYRSKGGKDIPRLRALGRNQGKPCMKSSEMAHNDEQELLPENSFVSIQEQGSPNVKRGVHGSAHTCAIHSVVRGTEVVRRNQEALPSAEGGGNVGGKDLLKGLSSAGSRGGWVRRLIQREESDVGMGAHLTEREGCTGGHMHTNGTDVHEQEDASWRTMHLGDSLTDIRGLEERNEGFRGVKTVSDCRQYGPSRSGTEHDWHRHMVRGEGLREWKGGFARGQCLHELEGDNLRVEREGSGGYSERSSPARGLGHRLDLGKKGEIRPASAPRRMQGASGERRVHPPNEGRIEVEINDERETKVAGTFKTKRTKVVKEDCERFRLQMKMLKEKAEDSRIREVEVEGMADSLQRRLVDEMDLVTLGNGNGPREVRQRQATRGRNGEKNRVNFRDVYTLLQSPTHNGGDASKKVDGGERVGYGSLGKLEGGSPGRSSKGTGNSSPSLGRRSQRKKADETKDAHTEFEARRVTLTGCLSSYSNSTNSSTSGSSSPSLSSLPLSHYIQKLKHLAPKSPSSHNLFTSFSKAAGGCCNFDRKHNSDSTDTATAISLAVGGDNERDSVLMSPRSPAVLLPKPPTSSHAQDCSLGSQCNNSAGSYSSLNRILGGCAMVASQLQQQQKEGKSSGKHGPKFLISAEDLSLQGLSSHFSEGIYYEAYDEKLANIQRLVGELKGSVEGFKIRIEVESEGWRGRVEGLEKEMETLKDEADDEILETKRSIRNEVKVKLGELLADAEKIRREEKEQVESLVDGRIEKRLAEKDIGMAEMKSEIRLLWAEVEALSRAREEVQGHVDHLTQVDQTAREHANHEQHLLKSENTFLRKQLQSLNNDGVQVRLDSDPFQVEREDLKQAMEKLKEEGTNMKLEIQGLKKIEKVLKVEIENLHNHVEKMQEDSEGLERERGTSQIESARERLLIMERVESLSQLYLGGLEEVRADILNVKYSCRDRVDELESQWGEFKRQQENSSEEGSSLVPRQLLLDELDHFRHEMVEMVETERGLLRETLERESGSIWHHAMDVCSNNKSEIMSMLKVEVQNRLHSAREKVLLMTETLKGDMDSLKFELGQAREGAEGLGRAVSMVEREKDMAAAAAAEATMAAAKAGDILTEMLESFGSEMANARRKSLQLQENLAIERDMAAAAASEARRVSEELMKEKEFALLAVAEARQKNQELQDYLERERSKILSTMALVHKERETASQAASEATSSALKAGEVLAEVLGSFNSEMTKARRMSIQLQEGLEKEREGLEHEREVAIQHSQEAQDRFSEDLELAVAGWKRAMNAEVAKAKEVTEGLKEEKRRASFTLEQASLVSNQITTSHQAQNDLECYISKTEDALSSLSTTVKQLQESRDHYHEEKNLHVVVKQQELERRERDSIWKSENYQLNQVVRMLEKQLHDSVAEQSEVGKRIRKLEGMQIDLAQSFEEVRSSTGDLEKTAANWLPKYEAAARIVNDVSSKMERMEEKFQGICCDESLMKQIAQVAESKVQGLKDKVSSASLKDIGSQLKGLFERVENGDRAHCQAISVLETRVNVLESSVGHTEAKGQSLKLEYFEEGGRPMDGNIPTMGSLSLSVEALERRMEMIEAEHNDTLAVGLGSVLDSRLVGLESRLEHVASATFTNLRLLDSKVEHVTVGVQSALEGAAMAENKCGALGAELVKVFRMLTACKQSSPHYRQNNRHSPSRNCGRRGRSHSPPARTFGRHVDSRSQSPPSRTSGYLNSSPSRTNVHSLMRRSGIHISPSRIRTCCKRGVRGRAGEAEFAKGTQSSEMRKATTRQERDRPDGGYSGASEGGSPTKSRWNYLQNFPPENEKEVFVRECKLHGQALSVVDECNQGDNCSLDGCLTIEKRQEGSTNNCQRTNIRLEAGRIHVNVSHHSGLVNQSEKRADLIAVQS